ncbi:ABC transporter substrate-binding protein [Pseudomaricurvus sp. HS19]|uniref:substrate-binding periplasmic protein n=1 Tax=Pseudomaricurvus sp. HS19 TaxID=2692626 RepID=UPI001369C331|nr:transporter substrate-binding domain-containing protein [Pseudomaricurvus sp. HS19]MYM64872.1 transporter substrate-binding domain-containing protein [Pseudomaricurvus sp. HS19]
MKRLVAAKVLLGLLMSLSLWVQARSYDDIVASGYIEFAVYQNFPPYSWQEKGRPTGIDIELGEAIAARLGVEPRWLWIAAGETVEDDMRNALWKGHIVTRHKADVMLRAPYDRKFSYSVDGYGLPRNDMVFMTAPYHSESWQLARNLDKVGAVRNLAIFQYQPIGVEIDSLPDFYLAGAYQGRLTKNLHHYPTVFEALGDFAGGKLSAVAGMGSQLEWWLAKHQPSVLLDIDNDGFEAIGKLSWDIGIAVKSDYRQLGYAIEGIVNQLIRDGEMRELFSHYQVAWQLPSLLQETASAE